MLRAIASKCQKLKDLRDGLKNKEMFFDTFSELEAISVFRPRLHIWKLMTESEREKLDLKVEFES